jgi:hypothetical protein
VLDRSCIDSSGCYLEDAQAQEDALSEEAKNQVCVNIKASNCHRPCCVGHVLNNVYVGEC